MVHSVRGGVKIEVEEGKGVRGGVEWGGAGGGGGGGAWKHSAGKLLGSWRCLPLTRAFQLPHQVHVCGRRGEERGGETHLPSQACPQTATAFHLPHQRRWAAWTTALIVTLTVIITTIPSMMTTTTMTTVVMMIMMTRTVVTAIQTVHRHEGDEDCCCFCLEVDAIITDSAGTSAVTGHCLVTLLFTRAVKLTSHC